MRGNCLTKIFLGQVHQIIKKVAYKRLSNKIGLCLHRLNLSSSIILINNNKNLNQTKQGAITSKKKFLFSKINNRTNLEFKIMAQIYFSSSISKIVQLLEIIKNLKMELTKSILISNIYCQIALPKNALFVKFIVK
jgi:hypothetical protein